jgi:two-component system, response regulator YesN
MLKVLIVEDEVNAREGLVALVKQKDSIYTAIEAFDGLDGYDKALNCKPDIVITDIRMPKMDGLTMTKKLREQGFDAQFIILSGYAEFKYAQGAVSLNVVDYLLKPLVPSNVYEILEKAGELAEKKHLASLSLDRESVMLMSESDASRIVRFYSHENACHYFTALIFTDRNEALKGSLKCIFMKYDDLLILNLPDARFIGIIIPCSDENAVKQKLFRLVESYPKTVCSYGYPQTPDMLLEWFERLNKTIRWSISSGEKLLQTEEVHIPEKSCEIVDHNFKKGLNKLFYKREYERGLQTLLDYLHNLQGKGHHPEAILQFAVTSLLALNTKQATAESINMHCIQTLNNLMSSCTFYDMETYINDYFHYLKNPQTELSIYSKPVAAIINEINSHYNEPISLNLIADKLGVTPQYLSRLFTKETNSNFIDYLTTVRIEMSKSFIRNTDMKIYEIAEKVGYPDAKYFCTIFKKISGVSPNQFKRIANE